MLLGALEVLQDDRDVRQAAVHKPIETPHPELLTVLEQPQGILARLGGATGYVSDDAAQAESSPEVSLRQAVALAGRYQST